MAKKEKLAFDPKVFLAVVGAGKTISKYRKGETIFAQGDPGDAVFFVEKGRVKVTVLSEQGKEAIIAFLGPGDFIGEGCLGSRTRRISTASTMTECVIIRTSSGSSPTIVQDLISQAP
jgi:CRP-like cAMP-binding protein